MGDNDPGEAPEGDWEPPQTPGWMKGVGHAVYDFGKDAITAAVDVVVIAGKLLAADSETVKKAAGIVETVATEVAIFTAGTEQQKSMQTLRATATVVAISSAVENKLKADWAKAEREGKTDELIAYWTTLGILHTATIVIGALKLRAVATAAEESSALISDAKIASDAAALCPEVSAGGRAAAAGDALAGEVGAVEVTAGTATSAERAEFAKEFYRKGGSAWPEGRIESHLQGIDRTKPVIEKTLRKGTKVISYQVPGNPVGNYFAPVGTSADALGIDGTGRVVTTYVLEEDVTFLQSTAADTSKLSSVPPRARGHGGGTQFFTPDTSKLKALP
jgi:hypothetical protein